MTEIPEHLLKRAAERRAAKAGGDAAPADGPKAAAPAGDAAATPAAAVEKAPKKGPAPLPTLEDAPEKAKPDAPRVAAAKNRKRIPYWAAPVLAMLPLWGMLYLYSVEPPPAGETDPIAIGGEIYSVSCAGCHSPNGAGGIGQQLNEGHTIQTFADPLAMVHWIHFGAGEGAREDGTYGDLDREGGPMNLSTLGSAMPPFPDLSPEELAAVVIYVRQEFGGEIYDPEAEQGFTAEAFEADPGVLEVEVDAVIEAGPGGDPDLSEVERAEAP